MPQPNDSPAQGGTDVLDKVQERSRTDVPWQTMLWNDPVNTTDYVTMTLVRVLSISTDDAERLMMLAHTEGKTSVAQGTQEKATAVAAALQGAHLWATIQKAA